MLNIDFKERRRRKSLQSNHALPFHQNRVYRENCRAHKRMLAQFIQDGIAIWSRKQWEGFEVGIYVIFNAMEILELGIKFMEKSTCAPTEY